MNNKKVLLMILDGWGQGNKTHSDAIFSSHPKFIESLTNKYPHSTLLTCGEHVGLPDGQMGNSEVGHLNIGAGRVVFQDLVRINKAIKENTLAKENTLKEALSYAKKNNKAVHFLGLVSDGGVHSLDSHLLALCKISDSYELENSFVHIFTDGRDTDPQSGSTFVANLEKELASSKVRIASMVGRYYSMDRDKRWDRVKLAYDLLVKGEGTPLKDTFEKALRESYLEGVTDEFIKPIVKLDSNGKPIATIKEGDVVICYNYRTDRLRQLTTVLSQVDMEGMKKLDLHYVTMTKYDDSFKGVNVIYGKDNLKNTLGEVISLAKKNQIRIAETEKYAHVTFFFNGGQETPFPLEKRILINSPKVATYDLQPEMGAYEIRDAIIPELKKGEVDFVCLNFANGDMVGHTGIYPAIEKAIKAVDISVEAVVRAAKENGYTVLITADHGNADFAVNEDGSPNTAHSLNPVPFIVVSDDIKSVNSGILADIAPTVLKIMGIEIPSEMDGSPLV